MLRKEEKKKTEKIEKTEKTMIKQNLDKYLRTQKKKKYIT